MVQRATKQKHISLDLDDKIFNELTLLVNRVGFENIETLIKNYLREVLISARTEVATAQLRDTIILGSSDLDMLKPQTKQKNS